VICYVHIALSLFLHFVSSRRRGGDSNSRGTFAPATFRKWCIQPLCHLSRRHTFYLSIPCRKLQKVFPIPIILCYIGDVRIWSEYPYIYRRPYRLTVRTAGFQSANPGSIPGRVTSIHENHQTRTLLSHHRNTWS
jgi:hypothetical protein